MNSNSNRRVTYLTAGAAGMYCGSCMHDNTLARALNQAGCDTLLVPTYTPIRTDETDAAVDQVFFGGINVYLQQKIPVFRHVPRFLDRLLDRPWLIRQVTSRAIETNAALLGSLTVSMLKGQAGNQKKEVKRLIDWLQRTARPDVVILSNILIGGCIETLKQSLNVPIIVTLQGDDIFLESLQEPHKSQAFQLIAKIDRDVDAYLVHSRFYADFMAQYLKLDRDKMHITPLGIDTSDFVSPWPTASRDFKNIGFLARLTADKGLHVLVDAFIHLKKDPQFDDVRLLIAGWLGADHRQFSESQFDKLKAAGLSRDVRYLGEVDRRQKLDMLRSIDVLSVPTVYPDPKGLDVLEALAAGAAVVQPAHGVFPELIDDLGGGLLVEPENPSALADALQRLLLDDPLRQQMGAAGRAAVLERRNAQSMAANTIAVIDDVLR